MLNVKCYQTHWTSGAASRVCGIEEFKKPPWGKESWQPPRSFPKGALKVVRSAEFRSLPSSQVSDWPPGPSWQWPLPVEVRVSHSCPRSLLALRVGLVGQFVLPSASLDLTGREQFHYVLRWWSSLPTCLGGDFINIILWKVASRKSSNWFSDC